MTVKATIVSMMVLLGGSVSDAGAVYVNWSHWCVKANGAACTSTELANPGTYRQILVFPTGYGQGDYNQFRSDVRSAVTHMGSSDPRLYGNRHGDRILFIGAWTPGGALGTPESLFKGRILNNPLRGMALSVDQDAVIEAVGTFRSDEMPSLRPMSVLVIFNSDVPDVTANASPPGQLGKPYGIARMTRNQLENAYAVVHELAHASLNFLDEYIEEGLENMNIRSLDILTPLAIWNTGQGNLGEALSNLFGIYDYQISEVLSANGNENMDVSRYPSRVATSGFVRDEYGNEGGMFFGKGTYHHQGRNLMGATRSWMDDGDGFDYTQSMPQERIVAQAFRSAGPQRPNDRIRNAGPVNGWPVVGSNVRVLLFDADKNHHFQATRSYEIQVGWRERHWNVCWWGPFPYPCSSNEWTTVQKSIAPVRRSIQLRGTALFGLANLLQGIVCGLGLGNIPFGGKTVDICEVPLEGTAQAFLPTFDFAMPYQDAEVPASQWSTRYYWRFRTNNGVQRSGWTGWADFYRTF